MNTVEIGWRCEKNSFDASQRIAGGISLFARVSGLS
jgi:hypothetical protein